MSTPAFHNEKIPWDHRLWYFAEAPSSTRHTATTQFIEALTNSRRLFWVSGFYGMGKTSFIRHGIARWNANHLARLVAVPYTPHQLAQDLWEQLHDRQEFMGVRIEDYLHSDVMGNTPWNIMIDLRGSNKLDGQDASTLRKLLELEDVRIFLESHQSMPATLPRVLATSPLEIKVPSFDLESIKNLIVGTIAPHYSYIALEKESFSTKTKAPFGPDRASNPLISWAGHHPYFVHLLRHHLENIASDSDAQEIDEYLHDIVDQHWADFAPHIKLLLESLPSGKAGAIKENIRFDPYKNSSRELVEFGIGYRDGKAIRPSKLLQKYFREPTLVRVMKEKPMNPPNKAGMGFVIGRGSNSYYIVTCVHVLAFAVSTPEKQVRQDETFLVNTTDGLELLAKVRWLNQKVEQQLVSIRQKCLKEAKWLEPEIENQIESMRQQIKMYIDNVRRKSLRKIGTLGLGYKRQIKSLSQADSDNIKLKDEEVKKQIGFIYQDAKEKIYFMLRKTLAPIASYEIEVKNQVAEIKKGAEESIELLKLESELKFGLIRHQILKTLKSPDTNIERGIKTTLGTSLEDIKGLERNVENKIASIHKEYSERTSRQDGKNEKFLELFFKDIEAQGKDWGADQDIAILEVNVPDGVILVPWQSAPISLPANGETRCQCWAQVTDGSSWSEELVSDIIFKGDVSNDGYYLIRDSPSNTNIKKGSSGSPIFSLNEPNRTIGMVRALLPTKSTQKTRQIQIVPTALILRMLQRR